jgi:hypothetical protein
MAEADGAVTFCRPTALRRPTLQTSDAAKSIAAADSRHQPLSGPNDVGHERQLRACDRTIFQAFKEIGKRRGEPAERDTLRLDS